MSRYNKLRLALAETYILERLIPPFQLLSGREGGRYRRRMMTARILRPETATGLSIGFLKQ